LKQRHQTVLIVTHDVEFAAAVCSHTVLLDGGRAVYVGRAADLLRDPQTLRDHGLELASWLYE
jgi:ABC-type polar amino acid transport system ATPase subunit